MIKPNTQAIVAYPTPCCKNDSHLGELLTVEWVQRVESTCQHCGREAAVLCAGEWDNEQCYAVVELRELPGEAATRADQLGERA